MTTKETVTTTINIKELIEKEIHRQGYIFERIITANIPDQIEVGYSIRTKSFDVNPELFKLCYHISRKPVQVIYRPDLDTIKTLIKQAVFELPITEQSVLMTSLGFQPELPNTAKRLKEVITDLLLERFSPEEVNDMPIRSKDDAGKKLIRQIRKSVRESFILKYHPTVLDKPDDELLALGKSEFLGLTSTPKGEKLEREFSELPWIGGYFWQNATTDVERAQLIREYFKK